MIKAKRKSLKITLSLIAGFTLLLMIGAGFTGILSADPLDKSNSAYPPLLEKLAERFDLDIDEVMDFMKELREEKKTEMESIFEEKLDELVENGDITGEQKEAILDKRQELMNFKEGIGDMKVSEAKEALKDLKEELKDWAEENDLEPKYFFPKTAKKFGSVKFRGFGFGCRR